VLFSVLWWFTRRPRPRYAAAGLFLVGYAIARIGVEFVRLPDVGIGYIAFGWLTMGQILSLPMLLAGAILLWAAYRYRIPSGNYGPKSGEPALAGAQGVAGPPSSQLPRPSADAPAAAAARRRKTEPAGRGSSAH
jgi:hypothetical protein